ncbi:MAG TPA: alpha-L-fucosidase [Capsulimonadaceae bacterium]|jgi:alpha-L-fucosidase
MNENLILPTAQQLAFSDSELGVIIHLDLQVFEPGYEFRQQWGYTPDPAVFNPSNLDTDQWIEAAAAAGAKYAVFVAKHCSGFSLWPTKAHDYSVASSPWKGGKGDVVGDFFASCEKYGIKPGLYYSVSCNAHFNVDNPGLVRDRDTEKQRRYNEIVLQQMTELWSNYGELFYLWYDGGVLPPEEGGPDVATLMSRLQPNACAFQGPTTWTHPTRESGNELSTAVLPNWSTTTKKLYPGGTVEKHAGDPNGDLWAPTECDIPNRKAGQAFQGGWFWREGDEPFVYSADELIEGYFRSVAQNANLLIGMVIDLRGQFPEPDTAAFRDFGDKLRRIYGNKLATTSGAGSTFTLPVETGSKPTMIVLREDLAKGERVRKFSVEANVGGKWLLIWEGTCIGHKRIERFDELDASELRLNILESEGAAQIREFSAYNPPQSLFSEPLNLADRSKLFIGRSNDGNVSITCSNPNLAIRYTTDGTEPGDSSPRYTAPFPLAEGGVVKAFAFIHGGDCRSAVTTVTFGGSRAHWRIASISLDSPYANNGTAGVAKLLDDDPETYWHTYHVDKATSAPPHEVVLDMGEPTAIAAFTFMPRILSVDATPDKFEFYLSDDGHDWALAVAGEFDDLKSNPTMRLIPLPSPATARYIRFVALHAVDDADYIALAGIGIIKA